MTELQHDWPCLRCRYNLRGLTENATCPECGFSIETSVQAIQQWWRHPDCVKRIRKSLLYLFTSAALAAVLCLAFLVGLNADVIGIAALMAVGIVFGMGGWDMVLISTWNDSAAMCRWHRTVFAGFCAMTVVGVFFLAMDMQWKEQRGWTAPLCAAAGPQLWFVGYHMKRLLNLLPKPRGHRAFTVGQWISVIYMPGMALLLPRFLAKPDALLNLMLIPLMGVFLYWLVLLAMMARQFKANAISIE